MVWGMGNLHCLTRTDADIYALPPSSRSFSYLHQHLNCGFQILRDKCGCAIRASTSVALKESILGDNRGNNVKKEEFAARARGGSDSVWQCFLIRADSISRRRLTAKESPASA